MLNIKALNSNPKTARILIQIGLAAVFLYAGVSAIDKPFDWTTYLPSFLPSSWDPHTVVKVIGAYELVLAAWLLTGRYLKLAGLVCTITLAGIIGFNLHYFLTTFRDVGLLFAALALIFLSD